MSTRGPCSWRIGVRTLTGNETVSNVYSNNQDVNSQYDAAGNLAMFGAMSVTYDAENR
jgi:hypothetical protein